MSPTTYGLQYLHTADPTDIPANGDVPVYSAAGSGYVPTAGINGNVTAAGTLTSDQIVLGQGTKAVATLGSLGTTTTVLHGNAAGAPTFATVVEADITLSNNTTNDATTSAHGFAPKGTVGTTQFWRQDWTLGTPAGAGNVSTAVTLTSNALVLGAGSQSVGIMGSLGTTTTLLHGNAAGAPTFGAVVEADITLADNTTNNVSTSAHGFFPKLPSGVPGVLLGLVNYAPSTNTVFSVSSTTFAAMDTTNLRVVFKAPASGQVLVRLTAYADYNSSGNQYFWGLLDGSSAVSGSGGIASRIATQGSGSAVSVASVVTGLTPGTQYTWDWAHATNGSGTGRILVGPGMTNTTSQTNNGAPGVMEVWAA